MWKANVKKLMSSMIVCWLQMSSSPLSKKRRLSGTETKTGSHCSSSNSVRTDLSHTPANVSTDTMTLYLLININKLIELMNWLQALLFLLRAWLRMAMMLRLMKACTPDNCKQNLSGIFLLMKENWQTLSIYYWAGC